MYLAYYYDIIKNKILIELQFNKLRNTNNTYIKVAVCFHLRHSLDRLSADLRVWIDFWY